VTVTLFLVSHHVEYDLLGIGSHLEDRGEVDFDRFMVQPAICTCMAVSQSKITLRSSTGSPSIPPLTRSHRANLHRIRPHQEKKYTWAGNSDMIARWCLGPRGENRSKSWLEICLKLVAQPNSLAESLQAYADLHDHCIEHTPKVRQRRRITQQLKAFQASLRWTSRANESKTG